MPHGLARGEMAVAARSNRAAICVEAPLDHDDRLRDGMPVALCAKAGRIPNEVVLRPGRSVREEAQADRTVVDDRLSRLKTELTKLAEDDRLAVICL